MALVSREPEGLSVEGRADYARMLRTLCHAHVDFLVGGAYALAAYTGIARQTKDIDVFIRPRNCELALRSLRAAGYDARIVFPHWLAKAWSPLHVMDVIFGSGNGLCPVDDEWFAHSASAVVLGITVRLCPVEEMIWQKAFIMERERYDGADICHLIRARSHLMDWDRLVKRFGPHWPVLLAHLLLFRYVYPTDSTEVIENVLNRLRKRLKTKQRKSARTNALCRGPLLSRAQFLPDIGPGGMQDARMPPWGDMTYEEVQRWTEAIDDEGVSH
jgi:hypothetical protein